MSAIIARDEWMARQKTAPDPVRRLLERKAEAVERERAEAAALLAAEEERCRGRRRAFEDALVSLLAAEGGAWIKAYRVPDDTTGQSPFTRETREYRAVFDHGAVGLHPIHVAFIWVPATPQMIFPHTLRANTWQPLVRPFVVRRPDGATPEFKTLEAAVEAAAEYVPTHPTHPEPRENNAA